MIISLLLFWAITHGSVRAIHSWDILPESYLLLLVLLFVFPFYQLSKSGRYRFLSILKRVSLGGIAEGPEKFGDILLADVLTSYAKVMGELFVTQCMFFSRGASGTAKPDRSCGGAYIVPLIISIPSIIRLRQCLIEFIRVRRSAAKGASTSKGWGGQHLANALKYSTAFPVIVFSALLRTPADSIGISNTTINRLWLIAVLINSLYSFYWDVTKDWDLTLLTPTASSLTRTPSRFAPRTPSYPYGLRPTRHFHSPTLYYIAIAIDFLLRFTWSFKLSPHLDHFNDLEGGIFTMEVLEVVRRWIWIFFRVETEWVRTLEAEDRSADILLGDFGKIDED